MADSNTKAVTNERAGLKLDQVPIFQGLGPDERDQIAAIAKVVRFQPGEIILREGALDQRLCVILSGQCEVLHTLADRPGHEPVLLAVLDTYDNFGEMSFFHPAPHSASVRASTPVELLLIEWQEFAQLTREGSSAACKVALNTVRSLAERLRHMDDWVTQLVSHEATRPKVDEWEMFRRRLFHNFKV